MEKDETITTYTDKTISMSDINFDIVKGTVLKTAIEEA